MLVCSRCKLALPENMFMRALAVERGFDYYCKKCKNEYARERRRRKVAKSRENFLKAVDGPHATNENLIFAVGDKHAPFHSIPAVRRILDMVGDMKPWALVQVGDLYDFYSFSKFPRSHNIMTPNEELERGYDSAKFFFSEIRRRSPGTQCFVLMGNHDARPAKRALEKLPEAERFVTDGVRGMFRFDGVQAIDSASETLELNDIVFTHGHLKFGAHIAAVGNRNVCTGHIHTGGVFYNQAGWELNCGMIGDPDSKVMGYRALKKYHDCTVGVGLIDQYGPRFIRF